MSKPFVFLVFLGVAAAADQFVQPGYHWFSGWLAAALWFGPISPNLDFIVRLP